jgi:hypothetical protein
MWNRTSIDGEPRFAQHDSRVDWDTAQGRGRPHPLITVVGPLLGGSVLQAALISGLLASTSLVNLGHMVTNRTACSRAEQGVMARVVTGNTASDGAAQAAGSVRGGGGGRDDDTDGNDSGNNSFHV